MHDRRARVVRHRSEVGQWDVARAEPAAPLQPFVRGYCAYAESMAGKLRRREPPRGTVELVINLRGTLLLHDPRDPSGPPERQDAFVAGLDDSFSVTETEGAQRGVQVTFTPLGAYMFLGVPMSEFARRAVPLQDAFGREAERLIARLHDARGREATFDLLDAAILTRLARSRPPSPQVAWAWAKLNATSGRIGIATLADRVSWSRRHLAARFREQVGLTPKVVARILRFRRAVRSLEGDDGLHLADLAQRCGYFDQAHMDRDFRQFAGSSPSEFRSLRLPAEGGLADGTRVPGHAPADA